MSHAINAYGIARALGHTSTKKPDPADGLPPALRAEFNKAMNALDAARTDDETAAARKLAFEVRSKLLVLRKAETMPKKAETMELRKNMPKPAAELPAAVEREFNLAKIAVARAGTPIEREVASQNLERVRQKIDAHELIKAAQRAPKSLVNLGLDEQ